MDFVRPNLKHLATIPRRLERKFHRTELVKRIPAQYALLLLQVGSPYVRIFGICRCGSGRRGLRLLCGSRLLRSRQSCREVGTWRPVRAITAKHIEGCRAPVEEQDQLSRLNLTDPPPADLVADMHTRNFCRRTGANNRTRVTAVHDNAQQRQVGRRRWRRRWRHCGYGRRCRRPASRGEQRPVAHRREAIQRLRRQRTYRSGSGTCLGRHRRLGVKRRRYADPHCYSNEYRSRKYHAFSRRQTARSSSVMRNSGSSTGRCTLTAASWILSDSTNT